MQLTQITLQGKTLTVPSIKIAERTVVVTGKWLKIAAVRDESVVEGDIVSDPKLFMSALKEAKPRADILTFAQKLPEGSPRFELPFELDNVAAIRITSYDEWWKKLKDKTRNLVRKAQRSGVVAKRVEFDDDFVRQVMEIYNETPIRQGRRFWHYGKDFELVKKELSTYLERSHFIGAYLNGELIGFMKAVRVDRTAILFHFLSKIQYRDKSPMNALVAKAVELCVEQQISHLIYGKFTYGNKTNSSLADFKRHNAFEKIELPRYYVPLTLMGRAAFALGLHRGLLGILPPKMVSTLRDLRSKYVYKASFAATTPLKASPDGTTLKSQSPGAPTSAASTNP